MLNFIIPLVLATTLVVSIGLCLQGIRHGPGPRLLSWCALAFLSPVGLGVLLFPHIEPPDQFARTKMVPETLTELYLGFMLINVIIISLLGLQKFISKSIQLGFVPKSNPRIVPFAWISLIGLGFVMYTNFRNGHLTALPSVLRSFDYESYYGARLEAIELTSGRSAWAAYGEIFFFSVPLPLMCLYLFDRYLTSKQYFRSWLVTAVVWLWACIVAFSKEPIIAAVFAHAIMVLARKGSGKSLLQNVRAVILFGVLLSSIIITVYYVLGFQGKLLQELFERIVLTPVWASYVHFGIFPEVHPFTHWGYSRTANFVLGGGLSPNYQTPYNEVPRIVAFYHSGLAYNLNTNILGDGWANFGFIGIAQATLLIFLPCFFWDHMLRRKPSATNYLPMITFALCQFMILTNGDAPTVILRLGLFHGPFCFVLLEGMRRVVRVRKPRPEGAAPDHPEAVGA